MSDLSHDPWADLVPPSETTHGKLKRVDPKLHWDIFWALDLDRSQMLLLQHDAEHRPSDRLPKLRGLAVELRSSSEPGASLLVIRLKEREQKEIFYRLCSDIVEATRSAKDERDAIQRFLARTWRWHWLLRGGRDERMSDEEQKGLIGELKVLRDQLLPIVGPDAAIAAWTGPLDSPKDFQLGGLCIEAKARRGAATPFVAISSEHQLETAGIDSLFLHVSEVSETSVDDPDGVSVTEMAADLRDEIETGASHLLELLDERLLAVGFDWAHDYSDRKWLVGGEHLFEVREGFPRVTPEMYSSGVSRVRYSISLYQCEDYRVDLAELHSALGKFGHGNES
jgi:hypothetical protein